jgi:hypothetical protein
VVSVRILLYGCPRTPIYLQDYLSGCQVAKGLVL